MSFSKSISVMSGTPIIQKSLVVSYVLVLVVLTVFPLGIESQHFGVALSDNLPKLSEAFGLSDAGSYLNAGIELSKLNYLSENQTWVINLWPPGMIILDALLVRVLGDNFAIGYSAVVVFMWSALMSTFALKLRSVTGSWVSILAVTALILSSPVQTWILNTGLFYAEGISLTFLFFALIALINGSKQVDSLSIVGYGILSGTLFASAAYFRSTFSTIELALFGLTLVLAILTLVVRFRSVKYLSSRSLKQKLMLVGVSWLAAFTLMEPWLQYTWHFVRGVRSWSVAGGMFIRNIWVDRSTMAEFAQAGGVGWGCEIDKAFCSEVAEYESSTGTPYPPFLLVLNTVRAVIQHPIDYLADRFHFFSIGWFSSEAAMGAFAVVSGAVLLFSTILAIGLLSARGVRGDIAAIVGLVVFALVLAPQLIGHVEPRYFIPLKLFVILVPWLLSPKVSSEKIRRF